MNPCGGQEVEREMGDIERERIIGQLRRCLADKEDVLLGYLSTALFSAVMSSMISM